MGKPMKIMGSEFDEFVLIPLYRNALDGTVMTNIDIEKYRELEFLGYLLKPANPPKPTNSKERGDDGKV